MILAQPCLIELVDSDSDGATLVLTPLRFVPIRRERRQHEPQRVGHADGKAFEHASLLPSQVQ